MITPSTRVSDALATRPDLREVLPAFHPAFARLNHPVLGRVLPKLVSVADAARIAGVDVDALVAVMNCPVGKPGSAPGAAGAPVGPGLAGATLAGTPTGAEGARAAGAHPTAARASEPAPVWFDAARETTLDARPILAGGEDPLSAILRAARALPAGGQLTVVAPFEPVPLVGLLGRQGWAAWTRWEGDACLVTFARVARVPSGGQPEPAPVTASRTEHGWTLDVRALPPPEPMRAVLAAVDAGNLPLRILHAREPALLWPRLLERGLVWTVGEADGAVVIDVRRA